MVVSIEGSFTATPAATNDLDLYGLMKDWFPCPTAGFEPAT
jgi:hypothetical protein